MEMPQQMPEDEHSTLDTTEVSMRTQVIQEPDLRSSKAPVKVCCPHQRLIDDIRTRGGKPTGKVRCLECGTIFDDPYQRSK
jgi:hypothetical protein